MFENDKLLRRLRLVDNIKIEIYQQGNRRKYGLIWTSVITEKNKNNGLTPYDVDVETPIKTDKFNIADTDETIIDAAIDLYIKKYGKNNYQQSQRSYYQIVQDPFFEPFISRTYGNGEKNPYYLNNGCSLSIEWIGTIPNPDFILGTFSTPESAVATNLANGIKRWLQDQNITSTDDDGGRKIKSKWVTGDGYQDSAFLTGKKVTIKLPKGVQETSNTIVWSKNKKLEYSNIAEIDTSYFTNVTDSNIISTIISEYRKYVSTTHGINSYELQLCTPDTQSCSVIEYKSPLQIPEQRNPAISTIVAATQSTTRIKLTLDGLPSEIQVKAKTNLPTFTVWTGSIPKPDDDYDDSEFVETAFQGLEESEIESPSNLIEVKKDLNFVADVSKVSSYQLDPNYKPGTVISLPKDYSHTSEQGYNILNSKWIGDLIASAKSHIGHPTYDISGTEKGSLGCASAVSMIFYRAFGVHLQTGKAVKAKPTDIGSFGTKGTSEAAGWFENANLYQKINWTEAQPGDIINTARNFKTGKAGHIGIVIDVKNSDGSWAIVSNSSKGFAGGGGGAVKQNYSVKKWQEVTNRNPSQTFAFRYIGPKLSTGQTA